ncbi:hypothetical protein FRB90_004565, partial [Tulasnella sp. 427]
MDHAVLRARAPALPFTSLNWLLLVLCIVIVIVVSFFLFYFNRLVAWAFAFVSSDTNAEAESLLKSDSVSNLPCRIHAGFEGLEIFFYNRTPAYDEIVAELRNQKKMEPEQAPYPSGTVFEEPGARPRGFSLDDPEVHQNTRVTVATRETAKSRIGWLSLGPFSRALRYASEWLHSLMPAFQFTDILPISFEGRTCAMVAGNDSTPSVLIAEAHKLSGTYGVTGCHSKLDLYKTVYSIKLTTLKIITRTNPDYQVSMIERGDAIYSELSST